MSILRTVVVALALAASGCAPIGLIYTNTTVPFDVNFDSTPVVQQDDEGDIKSIQYYVRVQWGDASIGEIAKRNGFQKVHYADLRTLSVFLFWQQQFVTIYGERPAR